MRTARWSQSDILRPRGGSKSRIRYSVDHICFPEPLTWIVTCCLDRRRFVHGGYGRNLPRFRCPATRIFLAAVERGHGGPHAEQDSEAQRRSAA